MKTVRSTVATAFGLAFAACPAAVSAQDIAAAEPRRDSLFARNRSVTVSERLIPGYERPGINVGNFNVQPSLLVGAYYVDNLYAADSNARSDVALTATPTVNAVMDTNYTRVTLGANAQFSKYLSRDTEDYTLYQARGSVTHDFGSGVTLQGEAGYRRSVESRADPGAINFSIRPILFNIATAGGIATWETGRLRLRGNGSYSRYDFRNGRLFDGTDFSQAYRDRDLIRLGGTADYAVTADLAVRGQVNYAKSNYDTVSPSGLDRSSRRLEVLGGASFEFTDVIRGEVGLGYINQRFDQAGFRSISGFGGRAQVEYLLSQLTTITALVSRTIEEAGLPDAPSYLRTTGRIVIDHELYRNLIVSAYGGYQTNKFRQPRFTDKRPAFGASARYRIDRNFTLSARYDRLDVTGSPQSLARDFTVNAASVVLDIGI